jgi:3-oxoacyl-[acyl-carrier-protein] synthase II
MRRAVVTGLGAVTALGAGVPGFWQGLLECRRALARVQRFDPTGLRNERAGEVRDWRFDPAALGLDHAPDLATQFALQAAAEALTDAGLSPLPPTLDSRRAALCLATNFGAANSWDAYLAGLTAGAPDPALFRESCFESALTHCAEAFGIRGPASVLSIACASGSAALGQALDTIRHGRADVCLAGGYDALAPGFLAGLSVLRTMSADDILPFSANRSGTLFGEGAGMLVVEDLDHARARGARLYAEVAGSWQDNNAYHLTAPDPGGNGMVRVLAEALRDSGLEPAAVDYVNAHGTGTEYHDPEETRAILAVLGDHAGEIPVSSIKGAIGHLMGAAGAVEAVATVMAMQTGIVPPTLNDGAADPAMDLDFVVNAPRAHPVRCAVSLSAGIGGGNACVAFRALEGSA